MSKLNALKYERGSLFVLDQLKIPHESVFIEVKDVNDAWSVIRLMQVRGAPLIAITAALGLAVEAVTRKDEFQTVAAAAEFLLERMAYLRTSRPTAVNLFIAMDSLCGLVNKLVTEEGITVAKFIDTFVEAAEKIRTDDIAGNRTMGAHGAKRILELVPRKKIRVLTICNTGSLATGGFGTALGVVRSLHEMGCLEHVYACETRPYNQGARLTAFEIVEDELPGTLITDSMASALMNLKGVDCVIVGADRIAGNGDTANKIGTYQLAITAQYHGVPFFTAAPTTTIDLTMASGAEIEIEERAADELTMIFNQRIAPVGINAWNPAFDVTPCALIRGIITEIGVIESDSSNSDNKGVIPVASYLRAHAAATATVATASEAAQQASQVLTEKCAQAVAPIPTPTGYSRLAECDIADYVIGIPKLAALLQLDPAATPSDLRGLLKINEVGDGNLNFVYIVEGNNNAKIVVKQALPYVRCVGESWPLTLRRAYFEYSALMAEAKLTEGKFVPEVYHFDEKRAIIGTCTSIVVVVVVVVLLCCELYCCMYFDEFYKLHDFNALCIVCFFLLFFLSFFLCTVMRFVEEPHLILRKVLMAGTRITSFAADIGAFMGITLFGSSCLALGGGTLRQRIAHWSQNYSMCALTEKVIFTDPYTVCEVNHWTTPQLDAFAQGIRSDAALKLAAAYHKGLFLTKTEALLHGDLHTGSVMVTQGSTFVIDPEFAFYGPMGFDIGAILSNLLMAYFSRSVSATTDAASAEYSEWILAQIVLLHNTFEEKFKALWTQAVGSGIDDSSFEGELYHPRVFSNKAMLLAAQAEFMRSVWRDTIGFTGMKMIRRVVGIAHVADLDSIADADARSLCEKRTLLCARALVLASYRNTCAQDSVGTIIELVAFAQSIFNSAPQEAWPCV
jgi:5-methylthioribose kinase